MDGKSQDARATQQKTGSLMWQLTVILTASLIGWVIRDTFSPQEFQYREITVGSRQFLVQINTKTGTTKVVFPKP